MAASILIIGANGRMGQHLIYAAARETNKPTIHAFVRNPASLPPPVASVCDSVQRGNALEAEDVRAALVESSATHIIVAIGVPNSTARSTLRADSAKAITEAIERSEQPVKVVVVSSMGAGGTKIKFGFGIGSLTHFILRHVLDDHDHQEERFLSFFENDKDKLLIVRPTELTEGRAGAKVTLFDGDKRTPSMKVDRGDVATWIAGQVCRDGECFGRAVNITRA
ncbi:hypothetical protein BWQ96_01223 [Gracilariopsis chorda]|uniref:NAD(P)-binding domain-containing protein n=1 Tax=Gracilariopsis chorda TaxID=448386 RepID=A0A2V3J3X2_9FLOR|nr:hypothetical protein BWQ96_01223 [Gracilariopsis chorda]|eukprot:PXF49085.1 hypothetical protein BWQ96_01223 [Gracilariopsis chorda]